jgi:biotin carboxylase
LSIAGKTLLVVSGGTEAVAGIERARAMDLHVVVSDASPDAPGLAVADETILASTYDVQATLKAARRYHESVRPIDGVICIASDVPLTVASVAEALGLPGIAVAVARLATDKLAMKERFAAAGVPVPWFEPVKDVGQLRALLARRDQVSVLKPVDSRGARGVILLTPEVDLEWAYTTSRTHSPSGRLLLEQYLPGPQISTESILLQGRAHTVGLADRNYRELARFAPFMIEDGGELPSAMSASDRARVLETVQQAADALGIANGVVKGDIVLTDGQPHVIEIAPRLSGGYLCTHEIPLATGVDFVGAAIKVALGQPVDARELEPRIERGVAQRWMFPPNGTVRAIGGVEEVRARPEIALLELRVAVGDRVAPVQSHPDRAGVAIATGATRKAAIDAAERAVADVNIETIDQAFPG